MKKATYLKLNISFSIWMVLTVILPAISNIKAVRVYEGTNFPAPTAKIQKSVGFTKKSLYISKRSWSPGDENLKPSLKEDRRLEEKWKDFNKRTMADDTPSIYKIKFTDKNYMQYLKYIKEIPRLEEYTFCLWYKSEDLSHDQTLFFYSLNKNEALLRFWFNALDSTLRVAIRENVVYEVPANIREHKWHHICQSWNGVLGELQIFLDGKRIGAGVISHYKGTYIPEGGEVTLGQDIINLNKRFDDGMDGEVFGFNLVDESVPHDQGNFINSQYRPNIRASVPPFKKLPPIKKTYQEIKAYISTLPSESQEVRQNEALTAVGDEPKVIKKSKLRSPVPPKRSRGSQRIRYPPLRKVVVYNRDDRQLPLTDGLIELNKTNSAQVEKVITKEISKNQTKLFQPYDENYSIHSYKLGKEEKKNKNYEIYEAAEDDVARETADEALTNEELLKRKARQNFNLYTARQANKVYTLSSSVKDLKKPKFHFETQPEVANRKSFTVEKTKTAEIAKPVENSKRTISDTIPVYEVEVVETRRKRSADGERQGKQFVTASDPLIDSNGFRRLPEIPDSFINLFTQNVSNSEMAEKLEEFFPKEEPKENSNVVPLLTEAPPIKLIVSDTMVNVPEVNTSRQIVEEITMKAPTENLESVAILEMSPTSTTEKTPLIKQTNFMSVLTNTRPVNFPNVQEQTLEFNPRQSLNRVMLVGRNPILGAQQEPIADKRRFDVSSGTDLVMRSYGECTADRGSPIADKRHLVISWADTPVRIFGGAQIEGARNECGDF